MRPSDPSVKLTRLASSGKFLVVLFAVVPKSVAPAFLWLFLLLLLLLACCFGGEQEGVRMWVWERKKGGEGGEEKG